MGDWLQDNVDGLTVIVTLVLALLGGLFAEGGWHRRQLKRIREAAETIEALERIELGATAAALREQVDQRARQYIDRHSRWRERGVFWTGLCAVACLGILVDRRNETADVVGTTAALVFLLSAGVWFGLMAWNGLDLLADVLRRRAASRGAQRSRVGSPAP